MPTTPSRASFYIYIVHSNSTRFTRVHLSDFARRVEPRFRVKIRRYPQSSGIALARAEHSLFCTVHAITDTARTLAPHTTQTHITPCCVCEFVSEAHPENECG